MSTLQSSESRAVNTGNELTAQNERAVRRLFERVYSGGELPAVKDLVAPDYLGYCTGVSDTYLGPAGVKSHATRLRAAFFGLRFDIDDIRGTPDGIVVQWTATGRLERAIMGVHPACNIGRSGEEPGGPEVTVSGRTSLKMTGGKVRESYIDWNLDELRAQFGNETNPTPTADSVL